MEKVENGVIMISETTTIVPQTETYNIVYSWNITLEEPTYKEIYPFILYPTEVKPEIVKVGGILKDMVITEGDIEEAKNSLFRMYGN